MDSFTIVPNLTATVSFRGVPTQFKKRTAWVRGMGGPLMSHWNMNPYLWNISNFAPVQVYNDQGEGGGVAMWQSLDPDTVSYVKSIQPPDPQWTAEEKVTGWLFQQKGRPGWPADRAGWVNLGLIVFGMNQVLITGVRRQVTAAPNEGRRLREVAVLQGMTKHDVGRVTRTSHPWLIHRATCVYFPNGTIAENNFGWVPAGFKYPEARLTSRNDRNKYFSAPQQEWLQQRGDVNMGGSPKGEVFCPFFHPSDYPLSSGTASPGLVVPTVWLCNSEQEARYKWRPGDPVMPDVSA